MLYNYFICMLVVFSMYYQCFICLKQKNTVNYKFQVSTLWQNLMVPSAQWTTPPTNTTGSMPQCTGLRPYRTTTEYISRLVELLYFIKTGFRLEFQGNKQCCRTTQLVQSFIIFGMMKLTSYKLYLEPRRFSVRINLHNWQYPNIHENSSSSLSYRF